MSNRIQPIKFLNWLFLRIKPSEYDPTKPLTFAGGFDGTAGDNLEQLETLQNDLAELGDQVSEIQHVVPSTANTNNLLATMADAGKQLTTPTDTNPTFCLQFGDIIVCGGKVSFSNLGAGIATEMPATLPVAMSGNYVVVCTPTADSNFDHLIAEYGNTTSTGFTISCDNMGNSQATNVNVSWIAVGKGGENV